jgi:small neutral amino acid transporter SnatA (MarC family)
MMNSVTIGALMIVGVVILYIFALSYVEGKITRQENEKLENNIDKLDDKA